MAVSCIQETIEVVGVSRRLIADGDHDRFSVRDGREGLFVCIVRVAGV
jgi:hypothetical protein